MEFATFVGPSYTAQSPLVDCERTINWFTETQESQGAKARRALLPVPGQTAIATAAQAPIRALFGQDDRIFAVAGFSFYELTTPVYDATTHVLLSCTLTNRGTVDNDGLPATISSSGDAGGQLFITSGGTGYIYDLVADTLTAIVSAATFSQGGYLDGYFLALDRETSTFMISDLLDGTTWDPLQTAQRNSAPDKWRALLVVGSYIYLFGSETSDAYYNAGAFPFPFVPVAGAVLPYGISADNSAVNLATAPAWLARSADGCGLVVRGAVGGAPQRISNHGVEYALSTYETIDDAIGWTYQAEGHLFYVLVFPTAEATWVYDGSEGEWHERPHWNTTTAEWEASRIACHCFAWDTHLVGDRSTGAIYRMANDLATDAGGTPLRRMRRVPLPRLTDTSRWLSLVSLQILMQVGMGLATGQGSDPTVMIRFSRDGGWTWGNEHAVSAGMMGQYLTRVMLNRLGRVRDGLLVVELSVSDAVPWRILGAQLELTAGAA